MARVCYLWCQYLEGRELYLVTLANSNMPTFSRYTCVQKCQYVLSRFHNTIVHTEDVRGMMANLTTFQCVVELSLVVPRKTPFGMKQNQGWRAGIGVGLRECVSLTHSQRERPAEWKVRRPVTRLALHCRAQAGNRKKNITPCKTGVLRVGRSGL